MASTIQTYKIIAVINSKMFVPSIFQFLCVISFLVIGKYYISFRDVVLHNRVMSVLLISFQRLQENIYSFHRKARQNPTILDGDYVVFPAGEITFGNWTMLENPKIFSLGPEINTEAYTSRI